MPRRSSISRLHELKYELRRPRLKDDEIVRLQSEYESLIEAACVEYHCVRPELLKVLARDFGKWVNDEKLPWIQEEDR
jgi:capsid portal protein